MAKKTTSRAQGQGKGMFFFLVCRWMQMINEESRCDRHRSFLLSNGGDGYAMQFVKKGKKNTNGSLANSGNVVSLSSLPEQSKSV